MRSLLSISVVLAFFAGWTAGCEYQDAGATYQDAWFGSDGMQANESGENESANELAENPNDSAVTGASGVEPESTSKVGVIGQMSYDCIDFSSGMARLVQCVIFDRTDRILDHDDPDPWLPGNPIPSPY